MKSKCNYCYKPMTISKEAYYRGADICCSECRNIVPIGRLVLLKRTLEKHNIK